VNSSLAVGEVGGIGEARSKKFDGPIGLRKRDARSSSVHLAHASHCPIFDLDPSTKAVLALVREGIGRVRERAFVSAAAASSGD
jgi:hypothetical protein